MLTAPNELYTRERSSVRRASLRSQRRDFAEGEADGGYNRGRRRTGLRLTIRGGMPESVWGRVAAVTTLLAIIFLAAGAAVIAKRMVIRDERFVLQSSSSISTEGNHHVSRSDLLQVFGADIERNIFRVSLEESKTELEQIPWVKRATVMRLLPDRIRVNIQERTPVAFVRQAGHIGLVDAAGVLLTFGLDQADSRNYSFPVVTGIAPTDPLSVRAARMKIFQEFTQALDAKGDHISAKLSEIDISNPEDVKALIPDHGSDVLVHFGDTEYLSRYERYQAHLGEWRAQYPKLSSVDMRYERQVVLEMQPGTSVPMAAGNPLRGEAADAKQLPASHTAAKAKSVAAKAGATGHMHAVKKAVHP